MKINYVETPNGKKLFSFFRHDYNMAENIFIDGGFEYTRTNGKVQYDFIANLIEDIREQFRWGKNYDKNGNRLEETEYILLKDIKTDHIINILIYFTNRLIDTTVISIQWKAYHLFFLEELKYRHEKNI